MLFLGKVDKTGLIVLINRINTNETPQMKAMRCKHKWKQWDANDNECNERQTQMRDTHEWETHTNESKQ